MTTTLAVIGGSGLYDLPGLDITTRHTPKTPFGDVSAPIVEGMFGETRLLFLARHGIGHTISPSEINYRANIFALKSLGAEWCVSFSAVGGLQEECAPGTFVIPDQVIDRTYKRESTFFEKGLAAHVMFGSPYCPVLREAAIEAVQKTLVPLQTQGTLVCMEGPAFSSRAESRMYRSWGGTIIGMTVLPEAKLAREAELPYATIAMVTDYDCWRSEEDEVDITELLKVLGANTSVARKVITLLCDDLPGRAPSELASKALENAIITQNVPPDRATELEPLLRRVLKNRK